MLRAGIALAFALFGLEKFPSGADAHWVRFFDQVGVGQWFRYFTGILATTMAVASAIHIRYLPARKRDHHRWALSRACCILVEQKKLTSFRFWICACIPLEE